MAHPIYLTLLICLSGHPKCMVTDMHGQPGLFEFQSRQACEAAVPPLLNDLARQFLALGLRVKAYDCQAGHPQQDATAPGWIPVD